MAWFNVHDHMWASPKMLRASPRARDLWVRAGSWCAGQLTDGFVPHEALAMLGTRTLAQELVDVGLWETRPGGYQFHDWADWNRTREQVESDREKTRDRQRKWRANRGL